MAKAHAVNEVHDDERAETERVAGSGPPRVNFRHRDRSAIVVEVQRRNLHGNLLVDEVVADFSYSRKTDYPGSAVTEDHLDAGIVRAMVKGAIQLTGKLFGMKTRHPAAEMTCSVGFVHLVDPELALHLVIEIDKCVGIHGEGVVA